MSAITINDAFIAAIEIGSSKITGMLGRRMSDGSTQVLAMAQENSSSFIHKGAVYNVDKTVLCLKSIKNRLQNVAGRKIARVYVCFGGQGLHSVRNTVRRQFEVETGISQELVDTIYEENRSQCLPDYYLVDIIPQEYKLGSQLNMSPVGVLASGIEGNFLNIVIRRTFYNNIKSCLEQAGIEVIQFYTTPIVLANAVLNVDTDKRPGCALVDFGRDTTTVAVYQKNLLRHLSVIPLGSDNVTKDIASSLSIEESEAESLKLKYGSAYTELTEETEEDNYTLRDGRLVSRKLLCEIVEARMEEILVNVSDQILASGIKDTLIAGAVLTGGGANIKDIEKAFTVYTNIEKLKVSKYVNFAVNSKITEVKAKDGTKNAILGMLAMGDENCAGALVTEEDSNLFVDENAESSKTQETVVARTKIEELNDHKKPSQKEEAERLAAEKAAAEAEAEKERIKAEKKKKREEWKQNNPLRRAWRKVAKVATDLVSPEDED